MKRRRYVSIVAVLALLTAVLVAPPALASQAPAAATRGGLAPLQITGSGTNSSFTGTFALKRFAVQGGQLVGIGTLTGTLTNTLTGATIGQVSQTVALPVGDPAGSCPILHLTLGPLDLNLLGLVIHLDRVVLDITAQSGPGNLLGNLLCSVAHLLDSNGSLSAIAQLLNQILAAL
jgi:hypothetical protein